LGPLWLAIGETPMSALVIVPEVAGETLDASEQGFEKQVETFELGLLRQALRNAGWNQRQAASHLGLSYDQFRHLYRKYHLDREKP